MRTASDFQWTLKNASRWNGDSNTTAVVGESAGGNMAASIFLIAKEKEMQAPVHQVLIGPVADTAMDTPSYVENAKAKPQNAAMMSWFGEYFCQKGRCFRPPGGPAESAIIQRYRKRSRIKLHRPPP